MLKIAQHLIILAVTVEGCTRRGAKDRCTELDGDFHGGSHQDKAADSIENHLDDDSAHDDQCQHDECIRRSAGEHAVRYLEEIYWNSQDKYV